MAKNPVRCLAATAALLLTLLVAAPAQASTYGWRWASSSITVSDQTGDSSWRVQDAVDAWNAKGSPMHLRYTTDPCNNCITVTAVDHIDCSSCGMQSYIAGQASWTLTNGAATDCDVQLSRMTRTRTERVHASVHEIGHCEGLAHAPAGTKSAMVAVFDAGDRQAVVWPTSYDRQDLRDLGY